MPPTDALSEARAFAESVAGVLDRSAHPMPAWHPGAPAPPTPSEQAARLDALGWLTLAGDPDLAACAALGAVELGRRLAPVWHVDRLLGASPMAGELARSLGDAPWPRVMIRAAEGRVSLRAVVRAEPVPAVEGLVLHRVLELGESDEAPGEEAVAGTALRAWTAAGIGYLAGLGQGALDLTVAYVRQRGAFGSTLGALGAVQQLMAGAAAAVRGVRLLAAEEPCAEALAHAGPAVAGACGACHQVTGAIGFTLEYPLHRYTQRARALATFNEALLDGPSSPLSGRPSPAPAVRLG